MESDTDVPLEAIAGVGDPDALPAKNSRKRTCVVCGPTSEKLHIFPKNDPKRGEWLEALGLQSVKKAARVCEKHFPGGYAVPNLAAPSAGGDVQAMDAQVSVVANDAEVEKDVVDDDVQVAKAVETGNAVDVVPPKKEWQLKAQVETLENELSVVKRENFVVKDENVRLKQRVKILDELNDRKNEELKALRKKVHNLQTMLNSARKSGKESGSKE